MAAKVTYSQAREHLAEIWDQVESAREPALLTRRGHDDMALIPAEELESLQATAYLLRSPANALRLLTALKRARSGQTPSQSMDELRAELGL
jgi:antitoxin YefM